MTVDTPGGLDFGESLDATINLAYVDIGAFGRIPIGTGPYLLVGPTLGLRIECSTTLSAEGVNATVDCGEGLEDDPYKTFDLGVTGGAGISFGVGGRDMVVEALYAFGVLNLIDDDDESVNSRGLTIRVGMDFGL